MCSMKSGAFFTNWSRMQAELEREDVDVGEGSLDEADGDNEQEEVGVAVMMDWRCTNVSLLIIPWCCWIFQNSGTHSRERLWTWKSFGPGRLKELQNMFLVRRRCRTARASSSRRGGCIQSRVTKCDAGLWLRNSPKVILAKIFSLTHHLFSRQDCLSAEQRVRPNESVRSWCWMSHVHFFYADIN